MTYLQPELRAGFNRNIQRNAYRIADDPCVMARSCFEHIAGSEVDPAAISTLYRHAAGLNVSDVSLGLCACLGARVLRPNPAGPEMPESYP